VVNKNRKKKEMKTGKLKGKHEEINWASSSNITLPNWANQ